MICKRCGEALADDTTVCPKCLTVLVKPDKRFKLLNFAVSASVILLLLTNTINACIFITGSHYLTNYELGIFIEKEMLHIYFPELVTLDIIFGALLLINSVVGSISYKKLKASKKSGLIYLASANIATVLWNILHPLTACGIIGIHSQILVFTILETVLFAIFSTTILIFLIKSDEFMN